MPQTLEISAWIVQLRDADGVVLDRKELPVVGGAPEVAIDPIALFGVDAPGSGRVLHVRREDGTETLFPCDRPRPIYFHRFDPRRLVR